MESNNFVPLLNERVAELSALLTYICDSPLTVHHSMYRAWGMLHACIEMETLTFEVMHKIYEQLHMSPVLHYPCMSDYQQHQMALDLALDILADLPTNIVLVEDESMLSIIASAKEVQ